MGRDPINFLDCWEPDTVAQVALGGNTTEFQRTTADVVTVENIQVFNETPETVQLELPPEVAPVSSRAVVYPGE